MACIALDSHPSSWAARAAPVLALPLIVWPWVHPFAPGPMPAVVPLLTSWGCAATLAALWALCQPERERMGRAIAWAWAVAALLSAAIGLMQYTGTSDWMGQWASHPGIGQAYGNLRQRNQYATLMNIGLAALLWFAGTMQRCDARPRSATWSIGVLGSAWASPARWAAWSRAIPWHGAQWALLLAAACVIGLGNAASSSRTGLVQLALLGALAAWWGMLHRSSFRAVGLVWAVAAGAYLLGNIALPWWLGMEPASQGALARLQTGDPPCASRLTLWRNVLYLIAQRPWTGWGWDELDYAHFITLYPHPRFCDILDNAHNLPLHLAVELGVPIAVLWTGFLIWVPIRARFWKETDPTHQLAWSVLAVVLLHSMLEYPLWYGPFQMACVLSVYLLWPGASDGPRSRSRPGTPPEDVANTTPATSPARFFPALQGRAAWVLCGGLLWGGYCAFAAWQYVLASQIYLPPERRLAAYQVDTLTKTLDLALFREQVLFAELTMTTPTPDNATAVYTLARNLLHFSPEPRVVERLIDSARMTGHNDEAIYYALRYRAAFPDSWADWAARQQPLRSP